MIPPHCSNRALKRLSTISVHKFALSLMVGSAILSLVIIFSYEERKSFLEYVPDVDSGDTTKEFSISDERTKNVSQFRNKTYKLERVEEAVDDSVIRFHPNLPKELLITSFDLPSLAPDLTSIRWTGTLYQESWKNSPKFLLYSALLDSRVQHKLDVRILALYDGGILQDLSKLFCVFWFEGDRTPVKTSVTTAYLIDDDYSPYRSDNSYILSPYMMTCNANSLKGYQQKPFAVSLFSLDSKQLPTNLLKISGSWDGKTGSQSSFSRDIRVGICGKALFYYNTDFSLRLIEWIEIMKQLGVSNIVLYKARCHKNVEKVLKYYESRGFVKIISFFYPPPYVSEPAFVRLWTKTKKKEYRGAQKIYLNDCLLRFKDDFDFVGVFDPDEIPVLKKHRTIPQFLRGIQRKYENRKEIASIQLMWKHFYRNLDPGTSAANVTSDLYILKHNMRSELRGRDEDVIETTGKCFYDPRNVLAVAIHVPLQIYSESDFPQRMKVISRTIAYTGHFGDKICNEECRQRFVFEEETALTPLQEVVAGGVRAVKKAIGLE